ncbi:MAG: hypothetical protein ACFFAU_17395 [Candidatus Hodarchaeota archaeon]
MYIETKGCSFNITLSEGYHVLVIENAGYCAGKYYRNRNTASIQYLVIRPENSNPFYDRMLFGESSLESQYYLYLNFSIIIESDDSPQTSFSIDASNEVSVFVTNENGLSEFQDEIDNTNFVDKPLPLAIIMFIVLIVIGIVTVAGITIYRSQKQADSIYTMGEKKSGKFISTHKAPSTNSMLQKSPTEIFSRFCSDCGSKVLFEQEFCSNCGKKLQIK